MAENIEEMNARRWEVDTDVSSVAPSQLPPGLVAPNSILGIPRSVSRPASAPPIQQANSGRGNGPQPAFRSNGQSGSRGGGRGSPLPNRGPPDGMAIARELQANRSNRGKPVSFVPADQGSSGRGRGRGRGRRSPEKSMGPRTTGTWAEPPLLETTQRAREKEAKALEVKLRDVYLGPLEEGADPLAVAYIIWGQDTTPTELLGLNLDKLNQIRVAYKVWIEWKEQSRVIKIASRSEIHHEDRVQKAVEKIREVIAHAKATAVSFTAIYIAAVPTADGMRANVLPKIIEDHRVTRLEFSGDPLDSAAKKDWKEKRIGLVRENQKEFVAQLTQALLALAPYKGWMRMRVHFGHVEFSTVHNDLKKGKYGYENFKHMLKNPRTAGKFERKLEHASIADNVNKRILAWTGRYKPVEGNINTVEEVGFKNTELIFVTTEGNTKLRIEADIEKIHTRDNVIEYQIGGRRLFQDNATNKKLEITTIDIENRVDWAVEVITDNSLEHWPAQLVSLIQGSVTTRTKARKDFLGLEYPGVTPTPPYGVLVRETVVRSVIQYRVRESGYVIEIAVYRTWDGEKTEGVEPKMASSVSLYHPMWDDEMESIERKTTEARQWDSTLSHFFIYGYDVEGISALLSEIGVVQGLLSSAQRVADAQANEDAKGEGKEKE